MCTSSFLSEMTNIQWSHFPLGSLFCFSVFDAIVKCISLCLKMSPWALRTCATLFHKFETFNRPNNCSIIQEKRISRFRFNDNKTHNSSKIFNCTVFKETGVTFTSSATVTTNVDVRKFCSGGTISAYFTCAFNNVFTENFTFCQIGFQSTLLPVVTGLVSEEEVVFGVET